MSPGGGIFARPLLPFWAGVWLALLLAWNSHLWVARMLPSRPDWCGWAKVSRGGAYNARALRGCAYASFPWAVCLSRLVWQQMLGRQQIVGALGGAALREPCTVARLRASAVSLPVCPSALSCQAASSSVSSRPPELRRGRRAPSGDSAVGAAKGEALGRSAGTCCRISQEPRKEMHPPWGSNPRPQG